MGIGAAEFAALFVRAVGRKKSLLERENGDCVLLDPDKKKCVVYDSRPVQCRTWPFWDSNLDRPNSWKRAAKNCRGCDAPEGKLYTLEEIEEQREKKF